MLPIKKVIVSATLSCVVTRSFHITGSGKNSIIASVTMLGNELQIYNAPLSMQWAFCTSSGAQLIEKELHPAKSAMRHAMGVQTMIPAVM